jgi:hypothetical protein
MAARRRLRVYRAGASAAWMRRMVANRATARGSLVAFGMVSPDLW